MKIKRVKKIEISLFKINIQLCNGNQQISRIKLIWTQFQS